MLKYIILLSLVASCSFSSKEKARSIASENYTRPPFTVDPGRSSEEDNNGLEHLQHYKDIFEWRTGADTNTAERFFLSLKKKQTSAKVNTKKCVDLLDNNSVARKEFLECLSSLGKNALTLELLNQLSPFKYDQIQAEEYDQPKKQTAALISWIEDLIRENLKQNNQNTYWYSLEDKKFLSGTNWIDFPFQDGDLLLSMGSSSISALIPNTTNPMRKYAHAFMVRVRDGKKVVVESLIEKGVIWSDLADHADVPMANVAVLRLKNKALRKTLSPKASDIAFSYADKKSWQEVVASKKKKGGGKTPYNIKMDWSEKEKLFCNQLIATSFAEADGKRTPESLVTKSSRIRSEALLDYLKQIGVSVPNIQTDLPSPGDFLASDDFEVVAEFRDSNDLYRGWEMLTMGDLFAERLEAGYEVKVPKGKAFIIHGFGWSLDKVAKFIGFISHTELGLFPDALNARSIALLATQEMDIFGEVWKISEKYRKGFGTPRSVLDVPPWTMATWFSYAIENSPRVRRSFSR